MKIDLLLRGLKVGGEKKAYYGQSKNIFIRLYYSFLMTRSPSLFYLTTNIKNRPPPDLLVVRPTTGPLHRSSGQTCSCFFIFKARLGPLRQNSGIRSANLVCQFLVDLLVHVGLIGRVGDQAVGPLDHLPDRILVQDTRGPVLRQVQGPRRHGDGWFESPRSTGLARYAGFVVSLFLESSG